MTLTEDLAHLAATQPTRIASERLSVMTKATQDLILRGATERAMKVGDQVPDFTLPDATGHDRALSDILKTGPAIVTFYRGGWCPYCNLELRAYQQLLPEIETLGASIIAISPQAPDSSLSTTEKNALAFPVLSDVGGSVADSFGLIFELPEDLQAVYAAIGNDLPRINGDGAWRLPIPGTYVVDRDRTIVFASLDADYRKRPDPAQVLDALRHLERIRAVA